MFQGFIIRPDVQLLVILQEVSFKLSILHHVEGESLQKNIYIEQVVHSLWLSFYNHFTQVFREKKVSIFMRSYTIKFLTK